MTCQWCFVCYMYGKQNYSDVNKLRSETFCKRSDIKGNTLNSCDTIDLSFLPQFKATLNTHTRRANYQTYIWLHAHERYPCMPDVQNSGWKHGAD